MAIKCFWVEPTGRAAQACMTWCSACDQRTETEMPEIEYDEATQEPRFDWDGAPWPAQCAHCGHAFTDEDSRSGVRLPLYRRTDNGQLIKLRDAEVGAMWDASWYPRKGPDGRCLVLRCPGGHDWAIDSRASNCTRAPDDGHFCWCRHGEPPDLTVDKGCDTCQSGGGSIWVDMPHGWHGHLIRGWLVAVGEQPPA